MAKVRLVNWESIQTAWATYFGPRQGELVGVLLRHSFKDPKGGLRCGLSEKGELAAAAYGQALRSLFPRVLDRDPHTRNASSPTMWVRLLAAGTLRNVETLRFMTGANAIETPACLDVPYVGPGEIDLVEAKRIAAEQGLIPNEVFNHLEDYGVTRQGESPASFEERLRTAYFRLAIGQDSESVFIFCGNSPGMNEAVGIKGVVSELTAVFLGLEGEKLVVLDQITPEFAIEE